MQMNTIFTLLSCLGLLQFNIVSDFESSDDDWEKICDRVKDIPFPTEDLPTSEDIKALDTCSSEDLYYGIGMPADPVKARLCAYIEMQKGEDLGFGGAAMLMTIYANGVGAKRNFELAIKFACLAGGAPAEVQGRVEHLEELKKQNWQGHDFSICDDITSGYMQGMCAAHVERIADVERENQVRELISKWSNNDKTAYNVLRKAADRFFNTREENEIDLSGTGRAAFQIEERASLEEDFIETLKKIDRGEAPKYSEQEFKNADTKLNVVYKNIQKVIDFDMGTVTKTGITITEREWIKYRGAWVSFCKVKYPSINEISIKTLLTEKRIKMLEEIYDNSY